MIRCLFGGGSGWKCWSLLPCVFFCVSSCIFQWILYSSEDMWSIKSVVYYRIYNRDSNVLPVQLVNIDIEGRFDKKISGWCNQYYLLETKNVILDHSFLWFTHLFERQILQSNLSRYIFITANLRFFSATAEQEIGHMDIGSSSPKRLDFPEFTYFFPLFCLLQITAIIRIIIRLTLLICFVLSIPGSFCCHPFFISFLLLR